MPNEVEAYRVGPKAFEFKGTNGFMITLDMTSKDVAPAARAQGGTDDHEAAGVPPDRVG